MKTTVLLVLGAVFTAWLWWHNVIKPLYTPYQELHNSRPE